MIIFTTCILLIHEYGRYFHLSLSWWFLNYIVCLSWRGVGFCQKPFLQLIRWLCSFVLQFVYLVNWRLRFIYDDFIFILLNHWKFYTMNFDQFYCVFSNFTKLYHLSHPTLCFFFCLQLNQLQFLIPKYSWMVIFHKSMVWLSDFALLEKIDTSSLTTET